ncbi:MAG: sigma-70 family RNA polymerase sigma factor [Thermoanaerobaculia bacterium]
MAGNAEYRGGGVGARGDVTRLLVEWSRGDERALDTLLPLVYSELRKMARRYLSRERPDHTLQPTAVVHEAFLRLVKQRRVDWKNRSHFFSIAARSMRRILVDHARTRGAGKRGGGQALIPLDASSRTADPRTVDLIALDDALNRLERLDRTKASIVEMRYFSGLTIDETAEALGSSPSTVKRDWTLARAFLYRELTRTGA